MEKNTKHSGGCIASASSSVLVIGPAATSFAWLPPLRPGWSAPRPIYHGHAGDGDKFPRRQNELERRAGSAPGSSRNLDAGDLRALYPAPALAPRGWEGPSSSSPPGSGNRSLHRQGGRVRASETAATRFEGDQCPTASTMARSQSRAERAALRRLIISHFLVACSAVMDASAISLARENRILSGLFPFRERGVLPKWFQEGAVHHYQRRRNQASGREVRPCRRRIEHDLSGPGWLGRSRSGAGFRPAAHRGAASPACSRADPVGWPMASAAGSPRSAVISVPDRALSQGGFVPQYGTAAW